MNPSPVAISVLLPVRDGQPWLRAACLSVLDNDLPLELVVVDDGSTDGSAELLVDLVAVEPRLRVHHQPHLGLVAALNRALSLARGPLVGRMDADDESAAGRLDVQVAAWHEAGAPSDLVLSCPVTPFTEQGEVGAGMARYCDWLNSLRTPADHWRERLVESPLCHPTVVAPTALIRSLGGWRQGDFAEDYDLWLRLLEAGARLAKVEGTRYRWRDHPGRLTRVDDRYAVAAFARRKCQHLLATWIRPRNISQVQLCGAGRDAKRWCDLLTAAGVSVARVFDLHPGRIGATIRGHIPVCDHRDLPAHRQIPTLVTIGRQGGRRQMQAQLAALGMVEAEDFLCLQ